MPAQLLAMYGHNTDLSGTWKFRMHGNTLMYAGIPVSRDILSLKGGDFASLLFVISEV